ncbi:hypothetical protein BGX26_005204 [Mortierella sp. AD094]|nr:hypothetical protein BGX26_005204 [Mortierella sp. AD094]
MILYGGFASSTTNTSGPPYNDIYILDVATFVWTRGSSSTTDTGRGGQACAVSGDYLIVWGGFNVLASGTLAMVYNIKTDTWTNSYSPPPGSSSGSSSSSKVAIIAGCVSGALVLILLAAGFIWHRKRSSKKPVPHPEDGSKLDEPDGSTQQQSVEPVQYPLPEQMLYTPYQPQIDQKQRTSYEMASMPTEQQPQYIYQPPVVTVDPSSGYYPPPGSQETGYYQPVEQHDYQPPVVTTDQATGYYQLPDQQPHIYQPSPEASDSTHYHDSETHHHRASVLDSIAVSPQTTFRSPQLDDAYHDGENHRASVLNATTVSPRQSTYRGPQLDHEE